MLKQNLIDLDAIVVSVSGGGMASGVAVAAKHLKPAIKGEKTAIEIISEITNAIKIDMMIRFINEFQLLKNFHFDSHPS